MCIRFCPRGLVLTGASLCLEADVELNQSEPSCLTPPEPTRAIRRWSRAEPRPPEANAKRRFAPNCIAPKSPSHGPCSSPARCKQFANSSLHFLRRKNLRLERRVSNAHTPYSRRPFKVWCYGSSCQYSSIGGLAPYHDQNLCYRGWWGHEQLQQKGKQG